MRVILSFLCLTMVLSCSKSKNKYMLDEKSEMAQLMLDMHEELDMVKTYIKSGQDIGNYPIAFDQITSAKTTDERMRNKEGFENYAMALIESEKQLYASAKVDQPSAYKKVVNACLACHTSMGCTGPIAKINKLKWSN